MPVYAYACLDDDCDFQADHMCLMADHAKWKRSLRDMECPECGQKTLAQGYKGVQIDSKKDAHNKKMKARFKKRNAQIEDMPPAQKKKMMRFMDRMRVRKDW